MAITVASNHFEGNGIQIATDEAFGEVGIVTEKGSLLINQPETTNSLGRPAGRKPEDYISDRDNVLAIGGNHYGWQLGAFYVSNGELHLLANDKEKLTGDFNTLCMDQTGNWVVKNLQIDEGKTTDDLSGVKVGMNGAQIVKDGYRVDVSDIADDPRIRADMRNLVDFSNGTPVPSTFFQDVRGFSPEASASKHNPQMLTHMLAGQVAVFRAQIPENADERVPYERLAGEVEQIGALKMDKIGDSYRLGVVDKLNEQKMPLVGLGNNEDGDLVVVTVNGRQPGSAGVSISQLADLMIEAGVKNGVLGCGGGDVSVVAKTNGNTRILNSPANVNSEGERTTRLVPNVLVVPLS